MKKFIVVLVVAVAILAALFWPGPSEESLVRTPDANAQRDTRFGPVIGSSDADNTYAWLGIPFAAPPLGELRWRAPRPVTPWQTPLEAVRFRDACVQLSGPLDGLPNDSGAVVGSEDCLYLNIWSPRNHSSPDADKLPVMVWIHGGGNSVGTANTYPGNRLASDGQVVVVTINYRLGFLGWMSHPALRTPDRDPLDASGNYANLDMIAALEWVQSNIANFGGDPDQVTVFGESAGGRNVYTLLASPLAKGLFHRAISQSGQVSTTPRWRAENFHDAPQPGLKLSSREWLSMQLQNAGRGENSDTARALQLSMSDQDIQDFMYSRSAEELLQGLSGGAGMYRAPNNFRDGTVLPQSTLYTLFSDPAAYNSVPLMTGTNRDEMKLFLAQSPEFVERRFGFLPRIKNPAAYTSTAAYLSDNWKAWAVDEAAARITENSAMPVYAYRWDWDEGGKNFIVDYSTLLGASHGLEVAYIFDDFDGPIMAPGLYNDDNIPGRDALAAQMRSYWSQFAHTGDPGRGRSGDLPEWTHWNTQGTNLMVLDTPDESGPHMVKEPMTVAILKQRVARDTMLPDLHTRCSLYVQLFLLPSSGDDLWDATEFDALGCGEFEPWSLEVSR